MEQPQRPQPRPFDLERITDTRQLIESQVRVAMDIPLADIQECVSAADHVETVMPYLDPTEYLDKAPDIHLRLEILRAYLHFRQELERIKPDGHYTRG